MAQVYYLAELVQPRFRVLMLAAAFTGLRRGNLHCETKWTITVVTMGLPTGFHFHDLRHTGNDLAAASGVSTGS